MLYGFGTPPEVELKETMFCTRWPGISQLLSVKFDNQMKISFELLSFMLESIMPDYE